MDEHLPREPDPELGKVIHPRSAKSFYSLSSGFVHGFKWQAEYLFDSSGELDDSGPVGSHTGCARERHSYDRMCRRAARGAIDRAKAGPPQGAELPGGTGRLR